ncbi:P-loop NTPase fold protein (plasmid) [Ralstonia pseudosolanacearum]
MGVEGDWGSGKSTVIQLVLSALRTQDDAGLLRVR